MGKIGFYLFGHFIAYYGLMIVIGLLVASHLAVIQIRRYGLEVNDCIILCAMAGLAGIMGAKTLYLIVSYRSIDWWRITELSYLNDLMKGGFVFLGGVIGAIPVLWFCRSRLGIPVERHLQAWAGCLPICHGFGRIGCFLVGCCYGIPCKGPLAVVYRSSPFAPSGVPLFPVQLVEAGIEFCIGGCLLVFSRKWKGAAGGYLYLMAYSVCRFGLEFLRYDAERGSFAGLSVSQWVSLVLLPVSAILFLVQMRKRLET